MPVHEETTPTSTPLRLETLAVHGGREAARRGGTFALPIDLSTTFAFQDLASAGEDLEGLLRGEVPATTPVYSRLHQSGVAACEAGLAGLEGTEAAVAFSSGMAALTAVLMAAGQRCPSGKGHVVGVRPIYGSTDLLLTSRLLGLDVTWVDPQGIGAALRPDTVLVVVETPANPTLTLVDLDAAVAAAGTVPVLVDNTFATPVLQNPARHGAALVLHSATKYLGGHSDVLAGMVATTEAWARDLRKVRTLTGNVLHPLAAYLLHRGLPTLPLRVMAAQKGARDLVARLGTHPKVQSVCYPGLAPGDARLLGSQLRGGGSVLSFEVAGGFETASALLKRVRLITPAVSLGSVDTLIQHPAGLTHRLVGEEARQAMGIRSGLLRLAVGLEHPDDLWQDLAQALATL